MDSQEKPRCTEIIQKGSVFLSVLSLTLTAVLFLRIETINSNTKIIEQRVEKIENEFKLSRTFHSTDGKAKEHKHSTTEQRNDVQGMAPYNDNRAKRGAQKPSNVTQLLTLKEVKEEIDMKLNQACSSTGKICQRGPPGLPGDPGYPGYKGEKGAQGKTGLPGPAGPSGPPGLRGKQGPTGDQGLKGDRGDKGSRGEQGTKGALGMRGPPGVKGTVGPKGAKGDPGSVGRQGPKGQCVVRPSVFVFPESIDVFVNQSAIFYCWVPAQASSTAKVTWQKLGGSLPLDSSDTKGVLHFSSVQKAHSGSYLCTVQTEYGTLRAISSLRIKDPPSFTVKPLTLVDAYAGSTVKLCCFVTGSPRPTIEWSHTGSSTLALPAVVKYSDECITIETLFWEHGGNFICRATNNNGYVQSTTLLNVQAKSCNSWTQWRSDKLNDGPYVLGVEALQVYCDMTAFRQGWTLIARFSNNDNKTWMKDDGFLWYDQRSAVGATTNPSDNGDMISLAFWQVSGREFKITRSDDPTHTALLQTTGNCLGGQTFRSKITSYGDFRNGKVWSSDTCLGSCTVQYDGQYKSTHGFEQAECSGNIQNANKIGFWCDWNTGDGSVMMIGGGGSGCLRADHGIGITESNAASFVGEGGSETEYDFGFDGTSAKAPSTSYSLNLWIR